MLLRKVNSQKILYFQTSELHQTGGFALLGEITNQEINCIFYLNTVCFFANKHTKHIQIITWSYLYHPSSYKTINCMYHTGPRDGA